MRHTLLVLLASVCFAATDQPVGPKVVFGDTSFKPNNNVIPFGTGIAGYRYQQFHTVGAFEKQFSAPLHITSATFSANPESTSGPVSLTLFVRAAQTFGLSRIMDYNLTYNVQAVFAGTVNAVLNPNNGRNEFTIPFQNPYLLSNTGLGNVVLDITVVSATGNLNGFYFGVTPTSWRVYTNLLGQPDNDGGSLYTKFTVSKVK